MAEERGLNTGRGENLREQAPSPSMVERAAKAHYEATTDERVDIPWEKCHPAYRAQQVAAMRAALAAIREPTEGMRAALAEYGSNSDHPYWWQNSVLRDPSWVGGDDMDAWRVLIDAALSEERG